MTGDPFACIPNASDDEYAGTELETPQQRERRERQHTIDGPHYDTVGHNPSLCWWEVPHCGPCWIRGEPRPANPRAKSATSPSGLDPEAVRMAAEDRKD